MGNPITEAEAVEIVAPRAGLATNGGLWFNASGKVVFGDELLNSRDALQPVLETMTAEEWMNLHSIINKAFMDTQRDKVVGIFWGARATKHLLTLPARTLCLAVAAAIKEAGK